MQRQYRPCKAHVHACCLAGPSGGRGLALPASQPASQCACLHAAGIGHMSAARAPFGYSLPRPMPALHCLPCPPHARLQGLLEGIMRLSVPGVLLAVCAPPCSVCTSLQCVHLLNPPVALRQHLPDARMPVDAHLHTLRRYDPFAGFPGSSYGYRKPQR